MAEKARIKPLFIKYFKSQSRNWGLGFAATGISSGFAVISPLILRRAIDDLQGGTTPSNLLENALLIVGVIGISGIFRFFMRQTIIVASRKIEYEMRSDLFAHLETLDRSFYEKTPTGDIMSRATNDLEAVREMYGPAMMHSASTLFTITLAFALMYYVDPVLTGYSLIPLPLLTATVILLGRQVYKRYAIIQEHYGKLSAYVQENLSGIRVVSSFVQEQNQIEGFEVLNRQYIRKNMDMVKIWGMFFPVLSMLGGGLMVMVLLVGGKRVIGGEITLGTFVAFMAYLLILVWPMIALGWVIGLFQRGMASMARIKRIFDREPIIRSPEKPADFAQIAGDIEFKNVSFAYNQDSEPVLKDISFKVKAGQTIAIVGATGCGKSTLISLLMRLYPIPDGHIFIDNIDVNKIALKTLRANIGCVPQDSFLFSESISNNIIFGASNDKSDGNVQRAATVADLVKDIDAFPAKMETIIGEKGITLSGGQKQRTSIARAIIGKPPILILDDAFSSVDTHTEEQILRNLQDIMGKSTVFLISHRISTIKNADFIIVFDDGRLVEMGDHYTLLSKGGVYAGIHNRQLLVEELETF